MEGQLTRKDLDQIIAHFGLERIVAALPQKQVCDVLELVCVKDLSQELNVGYDKFRSYMASGTIPYPQVRLLRRAYFRKEVAESIRKKLRQHQLGKRLPETSKRT